MEQSKITLSILLCLFLLGGCLCKIDDFSKCHRDQNQNYDSRKCEEPHQKVRSTPASSYYVAGVVEYHSVYEGTLEERLQANLNMYLDFIKEAGEKNVDILVFPEASLIPGNDSLAFPVPFNHKKKEFRSPCLHPEDYSPVLVKISCAARKYELYVVINTNEQLNCTEPQEYEQCPGEEVFSFNTNVVFDRSGNIIDKYRKINLFVESFTPSPDNRLGIFETDFGVRFGHFICFDVLFRDPAVQMLHAAQVKDIVFPTMWYSHSPFLTAIQTQAAYAYANDVNFIVAGANNVHLGSAGSGIYSGKAGALVAVMPGVETRKLLVSRVPKEPGHLSAREYAAGPGIGNVTEKNAINLMRDDTLEDALSQLIDMNETEHQTIRLSTRDIQCSIDIKLKSLGERVYSYRAVAYDGELRVLLRSLAISYCAVVFCRNDDIQSCGLRFDNVEDDHTAKFEVLQIHAKFPSQTWNWAASATSSMYYPSTLQDTLMPLEPDQYHLYSSEDKASKLTDVHMELKNVDSRLLVFGVYRRNFDKDYTKVIDKSLLSGLSSKEAD